MSEKQAQLRSERGAFYGPVGTNHRAIGMHWGGILLQAVTAGRWIPGKPVPPEIVTLCMASVKVNREAFRHKQDNIDDGANYLRFTGEIASCPAMTYAWNEETGAKRVVDVVDCHCRVRGHDCGAEAPCRACREAAEERR